MNRVGLNLMSEWAANEVQAGRYHVVEYGPAPVREVGPRSATCRRCGTKIPRGTERLAFSWDFHGCGSWTATRAYLHIQCPNAALAEKE